MSKLQILKQTGTTDEYVAEFWRFTAMSGMKEDKALVMFFKNGLKQAILDKSMECLTCLRIWRNRQPPHQG